MNGLRRRFLPHACTLIALVFISAAPARAQDEAKCFVFFKADVRKDATERWPWTVMLSPVLETKTVNWGGHVACPPMQTTSRNDFMEIAIRRGLEVMGGAMAISQVSDTSADVVFEQHAAAVKAARQSAKPPIIISVMKGSVSQDCDAINAKLKAAGATILRPC